MAGATSGVPIYADTAALSRLGKQLRAASPAAYKAYKVAVRGAAEVILKDMQSRAGYSKQIPGSGRVMLTPGGVKIVFTAPNAAPIENRGKGFVRHPVFGNREVWTDKNSHPSFAAPALEAHAEATAEVIDEAIRAAVSRALGGI